jgi:hypothetical protein
LKSSLSGCRRLLLCKKTEILEVCSFKLTWSSLKSNLLTLKHLNHLLWRVSKEELASRSLSKPTPSRQRETSSKIWQSTPSGSRTWNQ